MLKSEIMRTNNLTAFFLEQMTYVEVILTISVSHNLALNYGNYLYVGSGRIELK